MWHKGSLPHPWEMKGPLPGHNPHLPLPQTEGHISTSTCHGMTHVPRGQAMYY